jgi:formate C-acetyltransferase
MTTVTPSAQDTQPAAWNGFTAGPWQDAIDVRDFIQRNYTPYLGDASFLTGATRPHHAHLEHLSAMFPSSARRASTTSTRTPGGHHRPRPGYIAKDDEVIVGLQTDAPLKRAIMPNGGWRMVEGALETYGYEVDQTLKRSSRATARPTTRPSSTSTRRTSAPPRSSHIITGLPDAYGRGRIIGDYRRVALYGVDQLIAAKKVDKLGLDTDTLHRRGRAHARGARGADPRARRAEADGRGVRLRHLRARDHGAEAVQWLYFGYLAP